ncbi:MAG: hypothetical protein DMG97_24680 [Acidobacteria bacterium]|nr:MAG: hypothetical protein DMG97_24680 [Acidobacteriota bacterium]
MGHIGMKLKNYFGAISRVALGKQHAGRALTVFPDDIFLVGYYRSGSTWSRFIFGNFIHQHEAVTFRNVDRLVPAIYLPDRKLRSLPRIFKSHECFDPRYPRTIYIVRDPRDVVVSFYSYLLKTRVLTDGYPLDDFVSRFVESRIIDYADRVGCWGDHVLSWIRLRQGKRDFHLVRYEDLLSDPRTELQKAAPLLRIDPTPERIQRAIQLSSADHMRSLEKTQAQDWVTTRGTRQDIPFVREAKSGGWRGRLPESCLRKIEKAWGPIMRELGYELSTEEKSYALATDEKA